MRKFTFDAPAFEIVKSYRGDDGQMFIEGIASTIDIDQTGERMSPIVLAKMAARLIGKPLRSEHGQGWDDKMGEIIEADIKQTDDAQPALWIKAKLHDWNSRARDLFKLLSSGASMGLSVAGKINPGGIVKEYVESLGKWVPTYKDVDPTEVSVTDHPANLETFAVAVAKTFEEDEDQEYQELNKSVTNTNTIKPDEYSDVPTEKFLDPKNYKYPADEKHLMPALRYFNQEGQRKDGGYENDQWADMGKRLANFLKELTEKEYEYDPDTERVVPITKKGEEVNNMKDKGNLVSKEVNSDVADLIKQFNPNADVEVRKTEDQKADDVQKGSSTSGSSTDSSSSGSSGSSSSDSTKTSTDKADDSSSSDSSSGSSSGGSTSTPDSISSVLSSLASSLSDLKSSLSSSSSSSGSGNSSSTSTDKADSSSSSSDGSSSDSSSSGSSSSSDSSSSDSSDAFKNACKALSDSLNAVMQEMEKKKKPADGSQSSSPVSSSTTTAKVDDLINMIQDLKKDFASVKKSVDLIPHERKGLAVVVEKNMSDEDQEVKKSQEKATDTIAKMMADEKVSFQDVRKYKDFGILPKGYSES